MGDTLHHQGEKKARQGRGEKRIHPSANYYFVLSLVLKKEGGKRDVSHPISMRTKGKGNIPKRKGCAIQLKRKKGKISVSSVFGLEGKRPSKKEKVEGKECPNRREGYHTGGGRLKDEHKKVGRKRDSHDVTFFFSGRELKKRSLS